MSWTRALDVWGLSCAKISEDFISQQKNNHHHIANTPLVRSYIVPSWMLSGACYRTCAQFTPLGAKNKAESEEPKSLPESVLLTYFSAHWMLQEYRQPQCTRRRYCHDLPGGVLLHVPHMGLRPARVLRFCRLRLFLFRVS